MKFFSRFVFHLSLFLLFLPLQAAGVLLVPLGIALSTEQQKLPYLFRWFDNADLYVGRDTSSYLAVIQRGFLYRWYWLSIRNPVDYFSYKYLSITLPQGQISVLPIGDSLFKVGDGDNEGLLAIEYLVNNEIYYEYYFIKKLTATKCFRFRMGWKFGVPSEIRSGEIVDEVFSCTPWHSYTGS